MALTVRFLLLVYSATAWNFHSGYCYAADIVSFHYLAKLFGIVCGVKLRTCLLYTSQSYTGKAVSPAPAVTYGGKKLVKNTDYTVRCV